VETALLMFGYLLLFIALMIPGFILGKTKHLKEDAIPYFSNLLTDVAMPMLVFSKLVSMDLNLITADNILYCILFTIALYFILFFIAEKATNKSPHAVFSSFLPNCGFMGIPLSVALFPDKPQVTIYLSIVNVASTFILLTLGVYSLSRDKKSINPKRALLSPIMFAIVLGVVLNLTGLSAKHTFFEQYSTYLANLTTPLAMIASGFSLCTMNFKEIRTTKHLGKTVFIRLIASPLILMGLIWIVKQFVVISPDCIDGLFIAFAMPTAASASAMAARYHRDSKGAAVMIVVTTVVSVITLPLLYLLFDLVVK